MNRLNTRMAALLLFAAASLYMILALLAGHSAVGEAPVNLAVRPDERGLDVWKTASLLAAQGGKAGVVDLRSREAFDRFHVPGSRNVPNGDMKGIAAAAAGLDQVVLIADRDEEALRKLQGDLSGMEGKSFYYLKDGIRPWYLHFVLPVPLFSEAAPPFGYDEALESVRGYFSGAAGAVPKERALSALSTLAGLDYEPTLLKSGGPKPKAGGAPKRITGGCS
ncbi:MAG: rhodanese-like domain-containing protein [bacterium]